MSGPAKTCPGGQVLTANQRMYFSQELHLSIFYDQYLLQNSGNTFFEILHLSLFLLTNLLFFYKIMCFIKQIHEDKSLSLNHVFTKQIYHSYKTICFTKHIHHFYKIMCFIKQIY